MKRIGGILATLGLLAVVLNFLNLVPSVLIWIYNWGDGVAWVIKIALIVLGGTMYLLGNDKKQ